MHRELIVTMCNAGYVEFARNWISSLDRIGLKSCALIVTLDEDATNQMEGEVDVQAWGRTALPVNALEWERPGWRDLMMEKPRIIRGLLMAGHHVLYADADVVFLRDPMSHVLSAAEGHDLAVMQDAFGQVCAGFLYAKPTEPCMRLFDVDSRDVSGFTEDQTLLNCRLAVDFEADPESGSQKLSHVLRSPLPEADHVVLDPDLFQNGHDSVCWNARGCVNPDAYVVHYNGMPNTAKRRYMQSNGHWFR